MGSPAKGNFFEILVDKRGKVLYTLFVVGQQETLAARQILVAWRFFVSAAEVVNFAERRELSNGKGKSEVVQQPEGIWFHYP